MGNAVGWVDIWGRAPGPSGSEEAMWMQSVLPYRFIDDLKALPFVQAIYLFDSRARGDARPRSDIDLAIQCPGATIQQWQQVLNVVEQADTLLAIDCVRLDEEAPDSDLRRQAERL